MKQECTGAYDNAFAPDNVYGHALALLRRNVEIVDSSCGSAIHLDIGCGYGRIAEEIAASLDVLYVGVDADLRALKSLARRGFETHEVILRDHQTTLAALRHAVGGRRVLSVTMLDTLEHLADGVSTLRATRELIAEWQAISVISVPNVAHRDIGFRLAFGLWDYTETGLLDHTHTRLFSEAGLRRLLDHCGLRQVDALDVVLVDSDQHFPPSHPALAEGALLARFLRRLRDGIDGTATTNQFVRACVAGPRSAATDYTPRETEPRPFLSIVMRTIGTRIVCLEEALTCLAGQTDRDFEVLIVGHRLDLERQIAVEQVIEDLPGWLRARVRLIRVYRGNRTAPLNEGFAAARGHYIAILDDDDIPLAHWVAAYRLLAAGDGSGRILRATPVRQDVRLVCTGGREAMRNTGPIERPYPSEFEMLDHLTANWTPNNCIAFPRGVFHDLHVRFDEDLTTTEDWDFLLRTASLVDVASSPSVTTIYRWWEEAAGSSRSAHPKEEWRANYQAILQKMDRAPMLLPAGGTRRLRWLIENRGSAAPVDFTTDPRKQQLMEIDKLLTSTSWRLTAPLRLLARAFGAPRPTVLRRCFNMSEQELSELARQIRGSVWWKLTRPVRSVERLARERRDRRRARRRRRAA